MASKKATRKEQIAEDTADDAFLEAARPVEEWFEKNAKKLLLGVGAAVALSIVVVAGRGLSRGQAADVASELRVAIDKYREATEASGTLTSTIEATVTKSADETLVEFERIISSRPDHGAANLARLYAADLHRRAERHDKARALYDEFLKRAPRNDLARFMALEGAGYAAEELGDYDGALGYFKELVDLKGDFYGDLGRMHAGRVLELKGDKAGALAEYKAVTEMTESKHKAQAEERIAELE